MTENEKKTVSAPKRVKKTYAFLPSVAELIETHKHVTEGCEIDFISDAIRTYCAEIDGEKSLDVLYERNARLFRSELNNAMSRLSRLLFKDAVEACKTNLMVGANLLAMTDDELRELDNRALDLVRKHHGYVYLPDAIKDERQLIGGE